MEPRHTISNPEAAPCPSRVLWILLPSATLTIMAGAIIAPVLNSMREGLGASPASVGLIITTHGLFIALFSPLMGTLIDRVGTKRPLIGGLTLYGLAGGSGLLVSSYWPMIASRALLGIGVSAFFTAITVIILNGYEGAERDKVMGWRGSANNLGGIVWPLIGGALGGLSWHFPFAVYLVAIPLCILSLAWIPDIRAAEGEDPREESTLRYLAVHPILLMLYGIMFLGSILLYLIVVFVPQLLAKMGITSSFHIALFISTIAFAAGWTSFLYGRIRSWLSYPSMILLALASWIVAFFIISQTPPPGLIAACIALFGIGQGMAVPTIMLWVGETVPASRRGRFASYIATCGYIGQFLSPVLFAPILHLAGFSGIFLVASAICAAVLALNVALTRG